MRYRLVGYEPNGPRLGLLPSPLEWDATLPRNDVGALSLTYSTKAVNGSILARSLVSGLEVALEVWVPVAQRWLEPDGARFMCLKKNWSREDRSGTRSITAPAIGWRLGKIRSLNLDALLGPDHSEEGKRPFYSATSGLILSTLVGEYEARYSGVTVPRSFSTARDSAGQPWEFVHTLFYEHGIRLDVVLANLTAQGMCDWTTRGRDLRVTNPQPGVDRASSVILHMGRDVTEAPSEETIEELISHMHFQGGGGVNIAESAAGAPTPWGPWEGFASNESVTDEGTARSIVQAELNRAGRVRGQYVRDLSPNARFLPFVDFTVGEWITAPTHTGQERVRVESITIRQQATKPVVTGLILNDRFLDADVRRARRTVGIVGGSGQGSSDIRPAPEGPDKRTPARPEGLVVETLAYIDPQGIARGAIMAEWGPVTTARPEDGGGALEVASYELSYRPNVVGAPWRTVQSVTEPRADYSPLDVGERIQVRVRARGRYATSPGLWSNAVTLDVARDTTPPPVPSRLVGSSDFGVATFAWDGKADGGGSMPLDFTYTEVQWEGTRGSLAASGTKIMSGADSAQAPGLDRGTTARARARAVDLSGNESDWNAWTTVTVRGVLDDTDFDDTMKERDEQSEEIRALALTARQEAAAASGQASAASQAATDANNEAVQASERAMAAAKAAGSLVFNGDFERGSEGWNISRGSVVTVPDAPVGARVLRLEGAVGTNNPFAQSLWRPTTTGRFYLLTGDVRAVSTSTTERANFSLSIRNTENNFSLLYAHPAADVQRAWQKVSWIMEITTPNAVEFRVQPRTTSPGGVEWDNIEVFDVTEAVKASQAADAAATAAANALRDAAAADGKASGAQSTATQALTSANGRNARITSTSAASGTTNPNTGLPLLNGDTWEQWDSASTRNVIARWVWNGSWQRDFIGHQSISSVDTNSLVVTGNARMAQAVVDKIIGDAGFYRLLTAERLLVAPSDNMLAGVEFWGTPGSNRAGTPWSAFGHNTTHPSMWIQGTKTFNVEQEMSFVAGQRYRFEVDVMGSVASTRFYWQVLNQADGTTISWSDISSASNTNSSLAYPFNNQLVSGTGWNTYWMEGVANQTGVGRLRIFGNHPNGAANPDGYQWFRNPRIRQMVPGTLITPNAVTADKIVANRSMADFFAGTLARFDTAEIGWVKGTYISTDALDFKTANGLQVSSGLIQTRPEANRGIKLDGRGGVNVLDAFNGSGLRTFRVNGNTGDVEITGGTLTAPTIRTATTGSRVEMSGGTLDTYEGSTLQARMGNMVSSGWGLEVRDPIRGQMAPVSTTLFGARGYGVRAGATFNTSGGGDSGWLTDAGSNDVALFQSITGRFIITITARVNYELLNGEWWIGFRISETLTGSNLMDPNIHRAGAIVAANERLRGQQTISFTEHYQLSPGAYSVRMAFRSNSNGSNSYSNGTATHRTLSIVPC